MPLSEILYSKDQIEIPPELPKILKEYCKSAIRTQPYDLLKWSHAYFRALADGEEPPVKSRLEFPLKSSEYGLTFGFIRVLFRQLGADYDKVVTLEDVHKRWNALCLDQRDYGIIILLGKLKKKFPLKIFLSIAVGLITESITETMILICELFTLEPEGGSSMIPYGLFMEIYGFLANLRCDGTVKPASESEYFCSRAATSSSDMSVIVRSCETSEHGERCDSKSSTSTLVESIKELIESLPEQNMNHDSESLSQSRNSKFLDETVDAPEPDNLTVQSVSEVEPQKFDSQSTVNDIVNGLESSAKEDDDEEGEEEEENSMSIDSFEGEEGSINVSSKSEKSAKHIANVKKQEFDDNEKLNEYFRSDSKTSGRKSRSSSSQMSSKSIEKSDSPKCLPIIPGIGPQISAREIASIGVWMNECARRQAGLVGPRNIRHINCPPLEGRCSKKN